MMIHSSLAALSSKPCENWIKIINRTKDQRKVSEEIKVEYKEGKPGVYNHLPLYEIAKNLLTSIL
jgi:hypothetical protein